jgi:DNA-binding CsgD family transcriptional regulator/tetratricopeptide (TPR) repeat protein
LTPENAAAVAAVCTQLDGLPLAIELAAGRTASMSPTQFLARLGDRLKLLSRSSRIASPKQQTLEATFDWSYELLGARERTLFPRLGVFLSPFTLEDVEAVCSGDGIAADDVVDLIGLLTDKSLVVSERRNNDEVRYRLLETVRRYARSRLIELGEEEALQQRLARFSYSIAEQANGHIHSSNSVAWMDLLDEQVDNMRAALGWYRNSDPAGGLKLASLLAEYWDFRGHLTEGRMWLRTFLDLDQTAGSIRAGALRGAGLLAWRQGDSASAQRDYSECLAIGRSIKDEHLVAHALRGMADALVSVGDYGQADTFCRESLAAFRRIGALAETAETLSRLGNTILLEGDVVTSIPLYEESLALYRQLGDRVGIANQLWSLGSAELIREKHVTARPHLEECLAIRKDIKDELGIPYALFVLGYVNRQLGDISVARSQFRAAIPKLLELGDRWGIAMTLDTMADLALAEKQMRDALSFAAAADAVRASIGAHQLAWMKRLAEGYIAEARRHIKPDEADQAYRRGLQMTVEDSVQFAVGYLAADPTSATKAGPPPRLISRREHEVAKLVSEGHTNREIAQALFISERTVDNHVKHILDKLQFRSRSQIGAWLTAVGNSRE